MQNLWFTWTHQKLLGDVKNFEEYDQIANFVKTLFPGREDEKEDLIEWISDFGLAHGSKLTLENLKEILFIHRPRNIRDSEDLYQDVRKWIESIVGTSSRKRKRLTLQSSSSSRVQGYLARLEILFEGFMPFAFYQMFIAWIIRFLNMLSRRPKGQKDRLVGKDSVSFVLSKQKLHQQMCEFRFSVAGRRDIVFRVTGPPPLSRQANSIQTLPGFSAKKSIRSHFDGQLKPLLGCKEHKTEIFFNDGRRCVRVNISQTFVEWELLDLSLANDDNASIWFLSLSYFLSFETIFDFMRTKRVKKAVFLSNMSPEIWKERYQLEAKECKQNKDDNKNKSFVQLRPDRDEFYKDNLKWEYSLFKSYCGGAKLERYRLPTEAS